MAEPEVIPARDIGRLKAVDAVSLPKEEFEGFAETAEERE